MFSRCPRAAPLHLYRLDRFILFIIPKIVSYPVSRWLSLYIGPLLYYRSPLRCFITNNFFSVCSYFKSFSKALEAKKHVKIQVLVHNPETQQLAALREEVLYVIFLDLHRAYGALDRSR